MIFDVSEKDEFFRFRDRPEKIDRRAPLREALSHNVSRVAVDRGKARGGTEELRSLFGRMLPVAAEAENDGHVAFPDPRPLEGLHQPGQDLGRPASAS